MRIHKLFFGLVIVGLMGLGKPVFAQTGQRLVVSPTSTYSRIGDALAVAQAGDWIEVQAGHYLESLVVDKQVTLQGVGQPIIDGQGKGTVVTLAAEGVVFTGFVVQGSGVEPDRNDAGIILTANHITVQNNILRDVLFGIFVSQADDAILRGNEISSKTQYETGRQGDAIRLWYSRRALVENNQIHHARDVVAWYAQELILRQNQIESGRYGIHLMYCDGSLIESNRLLNNSVGIYTMYSKEVTISQNLIRGHRGPSGYALGFKDADDVWVTENLLVNNGSGLFLDNTPFTPQGEGLFERNILAFNDLGVILQPAVHGNLFAGNTFWENVGQVAVQGGGVLGENRWEGNFWSDYTGFDANGDGQGDTPYRSERFFEGLTDREPRLRMVLYSPAAQIIEFTGRAFPIIRPQPKLVDEFPVMQPMELPVWVASSPSAPKLSTSSTPNQFHVVGIGLAMVALVRLLCRKESKTMRPISGIATILEVSQLSKRYGKVMPLQKVSFSLLTGQSLALWGSNGAGKTTLLKAILGLIDFEGQVQVGGLDVGRAGKLARQYIGYVPQEAIFYDWQVQTSINFYARLKGGVPADRISYLLNRLGLTPHIHKSVSMLSGGLKQRLALAIALLADPPILLLDEPTANLDAQARREYLKLLLELRSEGKSLIFVSHRLEEISLLADRVLVLSEGKAIQLITPQELAKVEDMSFTLINKSSPPLWDSQLKPTF